MEAYIRDNKSSSGGNHCEKCETWGVKAHEGSETIKREREKQETMRRVGIVTVNCVLVVQMQNKVLLVQKYDEEKTLMGRKTTYRQSVGDS